MSHDMAVVGAKSGKKRWLSRLLPRRTIFSSGRSKTPAMSPYDPLPGLDFLRILEILPGSRDDEIRCRLSIMSVADAEDTYEAISYVWGDPTIKATIFVNGFPMDVTVNLVDALRAFRRRGKTKRVWADAICINQTDNIEKTHQVKEMGKIYASAYRVLVWLGRDDEKIAEDCFDLVQESIRYLGELYDRYGSPLEVPVFTSQSPISMDRSRWKKFSKLVSLPWFSRVWVIQEAALAKRCDLAWGECRMRLSAMYEIISWTTLRTDLASLTGITGVGKLFDAFVDGHCLYDSKTSWKYDLPIIRKHANEAIESEIGLFLDVLSIGKAAEVSFGVDRVYAFLGNPLARRSKQTNDLIIEPDYSKSVDAVYLETACALLELPREAPYLLSFVDHHSEKCVDQASFPSWVPRWDKGGPWQSRISRPDFWFQAGGADRKFDAIAQGGRSLLLSVVIFDELVWTSDQLDDQNFDLDPDRWDDETRTSGGFIHALRKQVSEVVNALPNCPSALSDPQAFETTFGLTLMRGHPADRGMVDLDQLQGYFAAYCHGITRAAKKLHSENQIDPDPQRPQGNSHDFLFRLSYLHNRRFGILKSGSLCIAPYCAQPGDICCVAPSMPVPCILRPREDGKFGLVGEAYIHDTLDSQNYQGGVMGGRMMRKLDRGEVKLESVVIV